MIEELLKSVKEDYQIKALMKRPEVMIGHDRTITNLIIHYCGGEPDWKTEVYLQVLEDDADSVIRVIRSIDIPKNQIIII